MRLLGLAVLLAAFAGCQSSYYEWGRYEDSVLLVTAQPDGFELDEEIDTLVTQIEETASKDRRVPPGLHAHLGWLFYLRGDAGEAAASFRKEKQLFPESAAYMDQLLERMGAMP